MVNNSFLCLLKYVRDDLFIRPTKHCLLVYFCSSPQPATPRLSKPVPPSVCFLVWLLVLSSGCSPSRVVSTVVHNRKDVMTTLRHNCVYIRYRYTYLQDCVLPILMFYRWKVSSEKLNKKSVPTNCRLFLYRHAVRTAFRNSLCGKSLRHLKI